MLDSSVPPSRTSRLRGALREFWGARELVSNIVGRDLKVKHRGSFLGLLWSLATPLLQVAVYSFLFRVIVRAELAPGIRYPFAVFFFCGLTIWSFFSNSLGEGVNSVVNASYIIRKLYFPRAILPLTAVLSALVTLAFEFGILIVVSLLFKVWPSLWLLFVPLYVLIAATLAYGLSLLLASLQVFYRDVAHFVGIVMQLWFWTTPVLYSLEFVTDRPRLRMIMLINPMTAPVTGYRRAILEHRGIDPMWVAYSAGVAVVLLVVGAVVFHRTQRLFPEMV